MGSQIRFTDVMAGKQWRSYRSNDLGAFENTHKAEITAIHKLTETENLYRIQIIDPLDRRNFSFHPGQFIILELPGIGDDLAGKIKEIVDSGHCSLLDRLHTELPPAITELLKIPGSCRRKMWPGGRERPSMCDSAMWRGCYGLLCRTIAGRIPGRIYC